MTREFGRIEDAIEALAAGRVVIVVDDERRENEGDFVAAAEAITPATVAFMIEHGRGLLCTPIMPEVAERLRLPLMVESSTDPLRTGYTVSVDHVGCGSGISAEDRARTIRALLDPATK